MRCCFHGAPVVPVLTLPVVCPELFVGCLAAKEKSPRNTEGRLQQHVRAIEAARKPAAVPTPAVPMLELALGLPAAPAAVERDPHHAERRTEVKELHGPFAQWLTLHRLPFIHARADKASGIRVGWPDFTICWRGKVAVVEFKWPGQALRSEKAELRLELEAAGVPYLLACSAADAITFTRSALGFDPLTPEGAAEPTTEPRDKPAASLAPPIFDGDRACIILAPDQAAAVADMLRRGYLGAGVVFGQLLRGTHPDPVERVTLTVALVPMATARKIHKLLAPPTGGLLILGPASCLLD